ncbi:MAG: hypothetical protein ACQ9MH_15380 [Nitrospinales bacterium]
MKKKSFDIIFIALVIFLCFGLVKVMAQTTEQVSINSSGQKGNGTSYLLSMSSDGRYVAFSSNSTNFVNQANNSFNLFLRDRQEDTLECVSIDSNGSIGNGDSWVYPTSMSSDGRYIAFESTSSNLVAGDTNNAGDIFVHDRLTGQTSRVSLDSNGLQANGRSYEPSLTPDGRYVTFVSYASNLVPNDTNDEQDIFLFDNNSNAISRVSIHSNGTQSNNISQSPTISSDGLYITFHSYASNLVPNDTNGKIDVFFRDVQAGTTERISLGLNGSEGNDSSQSPSISNTGRYIAFSSRASNLVAGDIGGASDIFVYDFQTGLTERVSVTSDGSESDSGSFSPFISEDGRYVTFHSLASNLVVDDTNGKADVFVHDRQTDQTSRASINSIGSEGNGSSAYASISSDGRYVAFESVATNLVENDTNNTDDVFLHDRSEAPNDPEPEDGGGGGGGGGCFISSMFK